MTEEDLLREEERERFLIEVEARLDELSLLEDDDLLVYAAAEGEEAGRLFVSLRIPAAAALAALAARMALSMLGNVTRELSG